MVGKSKGSKSTSKRCSRTHKFTNLKRAKQRDRKSKKLMKKSRAEGRVVMANKQALHLPNLHPFKAKLLKRHERKRLLALRKGEKMRAVQASVNGAAAPPAVIDDAAQLDALAASESSSRPSCAPLALSSPCHQKGSIFPESTILRRWPGDVGALSRNRRIILEIVVSISITVRWRALG